MTYTNRFQQNFYKLITNAVNYSRQISLTELDDSFEQSTRLGKFGLNLFGILDATDKQAHIRTEMVE